MKYNFKKYTAIASAICSLLLIGTSCEKKGQNVDGGDVELSVTPESLEFSAEGEIKTLDINTNGTISYSGNPSWLTVTVIGNTSISVEAATNFGNDNRYGALIVTASTKDGTADKRIEVTQLSANILPDDVVAFEDAYFESLMLNGYDSNKDGMLQKEEAALIRELDLSDPEQVISSLKGIEHFVNLESLDCQYAGISEPLDVSGLQKLQYLLCDHNRIPELKFANCPAITSIICEYNQIRTLDLKVAGCDGLQFLACDGNQLTSLDCSDMAELQYIACAKNNISDLKVSGLPSVKTLACYRNPIKKLTLQGMPKLDWLKCSETELSELNLKGMSNMMWLDCSGNFLQTLDVTDTPLIIELYCSSNIIERINGLDKLTQLKKLHCDDNFITSLDLTGKDLIREVNCASNALTSLQFNGCTALDSLVCNKARLTELDVTVLPALRLFECKDNSLTSLDVSSNLKLEKLWATGNSLTVLWMSGGQTVENLLIDDRNVIRYKGSQPGDDAEIHNYDETF